MNFALKRRHIVRIISFSMAILIILGGYVLKINYRFMQVERRLVHSYQSDLEELCASVDGMAITLEKCLYTGTAGGFSSLTNELVLQAGSASAALSGLPVEQNGVATLSKFLSQVSDYSLYLNRKVVNGADITDDERKNISKLLTIARELSRRLDEANTMYNDSGNWQTSIEAALSGADSISGLGASFTEAEESLADYPTLVYDGPFSDHLQNKESKILKSAKEISVADAKSRAAIAVSLKSDDLRETSVEDGTMPSYVFTFDTGSIAVTKRGGYITYFRKERNITESKITYEQAVEAAKKYIQDKKIGDFTSTYYFTDEGVCTVNFAFKQDDAICYTDLIKVGVAMDTGEIVFYEARGYIMNHYKRDLEVPKHTAEEAEEVLNSHLEVMNIHLAVIPSGGEKELYCYEFYCSGENGEEMLVYINVDTLVEEQILILLKTDGGTLTK